MISVHSADIRTFGNVTACCHTLSITEAILIQLEKLHENLFVDNEFVGHRINNVRRHHFQSIMKTSTILLCLYFSFVGSQDKILIDRNVQAFRQSYRNFQKVSLITVDRSFFAVYNKLNSSIFKVVEPFRKNRIKWNKLCKSFMDEGFDNKTSTHIQKLCDSGRMLIKQLLAERERALGLMFEGDLMSDTASGAAVKRLFDRMEDRMQEMWNIYASNLTCVGKFIKNYLPAFEPIIDNFCYFNNKTSESLNRVFYNSRTRTDNANRRMMSFISKLETCLYSKSMKACILRGVSKIYRNFIQA